MCQCANEIGDSNLSPVSSRKCSPIRIIGMLGLWPLIYARVAESSHSGSEMEQTMKLARHVVAGNGEEDHVVGGGLD